MYTIKGLGNEYTIDLNELEKNICEIYHIVNMTIGKLDVDMETAMSVIKQSHNLKDVGFKNVGVHSMGDALTLMLEFKINANLSLKLYYYRDANCDVEYGYYNHDYAYVIDTDNNRTLFDYCFCDDNFSIWFN